MDEFPGYRVDLLGGGVVIAQDDNTLTIPEGEFATATVSLSVGDTHPQLGQALGIRLVSLNEIPGGFTQQTSPDLEVDFDDVQLSATAIPGVPAVSRWGLVLLVALLLLGSAGARRGLGGGSAGSAGVMLRPRWIGAG